MFSKVAICNGSYTRHNETNPIMLFGLLLHIAWVYALHSQLDHPWLAAWISFMWQGSLSLQLVGNHYSKPWVEINEQKYVSFPARQIEVNVNYKCSRWFDWVFGGLNFHNEHHVIKHLAELPELGVVVLGRDDAHGEAELAKYTAIEEAKNSP